MTSAARKSLRGLLARQPDGANALIAYLTLGDPHVDFVGYAQSILNAGALTLELGIPLDAPKEGKVLSASHARARASGTDEVEALNLLRQVHQANPETPLIAVQQWPALGDTDKLTTFVAQVADAGASAVLVVGLPFGQLALFCDACLQAGVESVLSCFPDTPRRMRALIYRRATGCIYIARSRGTSGGEGAVSVDDLCREIRSENDIPLVVGFGIKDATAVSRVCAAGAHAAVVGSALVGRIAENREDAIRFAARLVNK